MAVGDSRDQLTRITVLMEEFTRRLGEIDTRRAESEARAERSMESLRAELSQLTKIVMQLENRVTRQEEKFNRVAWAVWLVVGTSIVAAVGAIWNKIAGTHP